jgi:hypothetical protein
LSRFIRRHPVKFGIQIAGCAMVISSARLFAQGCDLSTVHIDQISGALKVPTCQQSEFLSGIPVSQAQMIKDFEFTFQPSSEEFKGQARPVVLMRQAAYIDADWIRGTIAAIIASNIPKDSCDNISPGGVAYTVSGRSLVANLDVHYQVRTCTVSTCYKGIGSWNGVPYPIYERCMAKADVNGASATLGITITITPDLIPQQNGAFTVQVQSVPNVTVKEGMSELLKNVVGFFTFGIGSKAIQDRFDHELSDFKAQLSPDTRFVDINLPKARNEEGGPDFIPSDPYFFVSASRLVLAMSRIGKSQPSVACKVRKTAIQAQKFFESCIHPVRQYQVGENESLWTIAERLYGEGQYYQLIKDRNHLTGDAAGLLAVGQILDVQPLYEVQNTNTVIVGYGDSLWKIAKDRLGDPMLYQQLLKGNSEKISDPNRMPTLIPLTLPRKSAP